MYVYMYKERGRERMLATMIMAQPRDTMEPIRQSMIRRRSWRRCRIVCYIGFSATVACVLLVFHACLDVCVPLLSCLCVIFLEEVQDAE